MTSLKEDDRTNEDDNKTILLFYQFIDAIEKALNEFSGLWEPLREQGMGIDFEQTSMRVPRNTVEPQASSRFGRSTGAKV